MGSGILNKAIVAAGLLCGPWISPLLAQTNDSTTNWSGNYSVCANKNEFRKNPAEPLSLKAWINTANPVLANQFRLALDFWTTVIDMKWQEVQDSTCSLQLVDGTPAILKKTIVARSQFTDWDNFQGWIAFDPTAKLTNIEMYLTAVHEIGHMLGLKHNPNANSVMYYLDLEGPEALDATDLAKLAGQHKLRKTTFSGPIVVLAADTTTTTVDAKQTPEPTKLETPPPPESKVLRGSQLRTPHHKPKRNQPRSHQYRMHLRKTA